MDFKIGEKNYEDEKMTYVSSVFLCKKKLASIYSQFFLRMYELDCQKLIVEELSS